jgi:chromosome segregation ATPase
MESSVSFVRINSPVHAMARIVPPVHELNVLPPWSEVATIAAQLSIVTPAVIQMVYFRKQIEELDDKYQQLEVSTKISSEVTQDDQVVEGFSKDMKEALAAYKELYGSMSEQIDMILTNEEKRSAFEAELVESITGLQSLSVDITDLKGENKVLRNFLESATQSQKASNENIKRQQLEQGKRLQYVYLSIDIL